MKQGSDVEREAASPAPPRLHFRLLPDPARLLRARERIRDYLSNYCEERHTIDDAVLCIEEAASNAIRHSGSAQPVDIVLRFDDGDLRGEIHDYGKGFDVSRFDPTLLPDPGLDHGRGLFLIAALSDALELSNADGLTVSITKNEVTTTRGSHPDVGPASDHEQLDSDRGARRRALVEEINEGFLALDWEYRLTYANKAALDLLDLRADEVLGGALPDVLACAEEPGFETVRRAMELGSSAIEECFSPLAGHWLERRVYPTNSGVSIYLRVIDERKSGEQERDQARRRAALLASTASTLLATADPQGAVEQLCRAVMAELDCQVFFNFLVDEGAARLHLNAYAGIPDEAAGAIEWLDFGDAVCGCAARDAGRVVAEDIASTPDPRAELVASYGVQAYACHPLMVEGEVLGTLSFGTRTRTRLSDDDLSLMQAVADHVAIAMQRERAEEALRRQGSELQTFSEELVRRNIRLQTLTDELFQRSRLSKLIDVFSLLVHSTLDSRNVMAQATAKVGEVMQADMAALKLLGPAGLVLEHGWQLTPEAEQGLASPRQDMIGALAASSQEPVVIDDVRSYPGRARTDLERLGVKAAMAVPVLVRKETTAVLYLYHTGAPHHFSDTETDFAVRIAASISLALENARLYEEQRRVALVLQESFLHPLPRLDGLRLAALTRSADRDELIGGDFYDVFERVDGLVVALIGDVVGKGILAAGLTETVRSAAHALALTTGAPEFVLRQVNEMLLIGQEHQDLVTALCVMIDRETGQGLLSSAGHPPPVLIGANGARLVEPAHDLPLGVMDWSYGASRFRLGPGDTLLLYTDGLTEARRDGELFGERRLLEALARAHATEPQTLIDSLRETVLAYAGELQDDLQIVALQRDG